MKVIYIILVGIFLLFIGNWYYAAHAPPSIPDTIIQTEEQTTEATNLISAVDPKSDISFTYPEDLAAKYISTAEWPPRFVNSSEPITCQLDEQTQAMSGATSSTMTINGNTYCIWETREGAAGSTYSTYQVTYPKENQYLTMSFTLQYPQCMNFGTNKAAECTREQNQFLLNHLIDSIAQSAKLP